MPNTDNRLCFHVPGKPGIIDLAASRDGKTVGMHSGKTIEQMAVRYPGVALTTLDHASAMFRSPPVEITSAKFQEMLEVLPPVNWINRGRTETFKLAEHTYGPITAIFCRVGDRFYTLSDNVALSHDAIVAMVNDIAKAEGEIP